MNAIIHKHKNKIIKLSALLIIIGFLSGLMKNGNVQNLTLIAATVIACVPIFMKAYESLRMKMFSIELLVSIAVLGALYIHEYTESSVVTFLFLFGDYLEARTLEKTRSSLKKLADMAPKEAIVIRDGKNITISVEQVVEGDRVVIRSGGKVPVDGRILSGHASINESTVTGESVPTLKTVNDKVFSGTMVDNGYIEIIAEKVGDETTFAKIIELVEEAQESKKKWENTSINFPVFIHQLLFFYRYWSMS